MPESDILAAAGLEFPCNACGRQYCVTLRQVFQAKEVLCHEGCAMPDRETECPPAALGRRVEHGLLEELERVWHRLEDQARASGGQLRLLAAEV